MAQAAAYPLQFRLQGSSASARVMTRFFVTLVVACEMVMVVLVVTGVGSIWDVLYAGVFGPAIFLTIVWGIRRSQDGAADLTPDRLVVRTRTQTQSYRWKHIAKIEVIALRNTGALSSRFCRLFGMDLEEKLVRLRLRRSVRLSLLSNRLGTDGFGLPVPGFKATLLFLEDPEGFAREAVPYLQAAGSYRP